MYGMNSKEQRIEKITNRILINVGIGLFAYILLWVLFFKLGMPDVTTFTFAGLFAACGVSSYVLYKKKELPLKNYAYMFFAFCIALLFTKLSVIVTAFIGTYKCAALQNIKFFEVLFNTKYEVIAVAVIGVVYLVAMAVYNTVKIVKISKEKVVKETKKKKKRGKL